MPEYPDIVVYLESLHRRIIGEPLRELRILGPSILRSVDPGPRELKGRRVETLARLGKRIVIGLEDEYFIVIHLMIAGRLHWKKAGATPPRKTGHACLDFSSGTLTLTESGSKKRATLHCVAGRVALRDHDPGGLELLEVSLDQFAQRLRYENHTLKRSLTDPHLFSGVGNAYSDEILHRARLSPTQLSQNLDDVEVRALYCACREVLTEWTDRLRAEAGDGFPKKVTAFRPEMAVHGCYGKPCPDCGSPVQRIVRGESEANYCASCQTGGRLLADRALSRLLRGDWPRTTEELEARRKKGKIAG